MTQSYVPIMTAEVAFHCRKCSSTAANGMLLPGKLELPMQLDSSFMHPPLTSLAPTNPGKLVERTDCGWFVGGQENLGGGQRE